MALLLRSSDEQVVEAVRELPLSTSDTGGILRREDSHATHRLGHRSGMQRTCALRSRRFGRSALFEHAAIRRRLTESQRAVEAQSLLGARCVNEGSPSAPPNADGLRAGAASSVRSLRRLCIRLRFRDNATRRLRHSFARAPLFVPVAVRLQIRRSTIAKAASPSAGARLPCGQYTTALCNLISYLWLTSFARAPTPNMARVDRPTASSSSRRTFSNACRSSPAGVFAFQAELSACWSHATITLGAPS